MSSLNAQAGEVVANNVIAPISDAGTVCFYSSVGTDFVVDVAGWFVGADGPDAVEPFVGLLPERRVDTRSGLGGRSTKVTPSTPVVDPGHRSRRKAARRHLGHRARRRSRSGRQRHGHAGARRRGIATVWPCGTDMPLASNVNFAETTPTGNGVIAPIGDDGTICVHTSTSAEVIVDLAGYFGGPGDAAGGAEAPFTAALPTRLVDTREGVGAPAARVQPDQPLRIRVRGARARRRGRSVAVRWSCPTMRAPSR